MPTTQKRAAKPSYGLPSVLSGKEYIPYADRFGEENKELFINGQAWWTAEELVDACNKLFPNWSAQKWGNNAYQYARRLDAGASNPARRDNVYRLLRDPESGQYVMCSVQEGLNFNDFGAEVEQAAINARAKEQANLQKAHYQLDAETQEKCESQFLKNGKDLEAIIHYNTHPNLTLADAAAPQIGNGNGAQRLTNKPAK